MAFVNEFVSPEDFEKYGLEETNEKYRIPREETEWTIDKDRDIYIREIPHIGPSPGYVHFHMYWKKELFSVYIEYKSRHLRGLKEIDLPKNLITQKENILHDLKIALKERGDAGVFSAIKNMGIEFDF